jgi:CHASE2 domain-containing sensor protein
MSESGSPLPLAPNEPGATSSNQQSSNKLRGLPWRIGLDFIIGIALIFILLVMKWGFEKTTSGKFVDLMTYCWIQSRFAVDQDKFPIVVVDISNLDTDRLPGRLTPRAELIALLDAVMRRGPAAVGIDVDFSFDPKDQGWPPRGGPQLLEYIQNHQGHDYNAPIFLGVNRTREGEAKQWLGAEEYADLAANVVIPAKEYRRMPLWIRRGSGSCSYLVDDLIEVALKVEPDKYAKAGGEKATCLPSLSLALARKFPGIELHGVPWPHWLFRAIDEIPTDEAERFHTAYTSTNYSAVKYLEQLTSTAAVSNTDVILDVNRNVSTLKGKIVLLGNASRFEQIDKFPMLITPDPWPQDVPGVYLHASATYTLIKGPLFEVTPGGRIFLDLIFAGVVVIGVSLLRLLYCKWMQTEGAVQTEVATHRVHWLFTSLAVFAVVVIGYGTVQYHRILWTDWLLVVGGLLLHARFGRHAETWANWVIANAPAIWRRLIFVHPAAHE